MATTEDRPPTIEERYRAAINTSNLAVDPRSFRAPSDVVGAMGLADKHLTAGWVTTGPDGQGHPIHPSPLAVPLERLFGGDSRVASEIIAILADMVFDQSWVMRVKISRVSAQDMAKACLAWHQHGTCRACGGHGYELIPGSRTHSERECHACHGNRKIPFEDAFPDKWRELAKWAVVQIDREAGHAGPRAMQTIGGLMDL
jgi:hypothetical protein